MSRFTFNKQPLAIAVRLFTQAAVVSAAGLLGGQLAIAQTQQNDQGNTGGVSATSLERVVVTAQRREEVAQDVAVALTALSGKELEDKGITNINQLQYQTPNLEIDAAYGSSQTLFRIRGVGLRDYATNNTSTVGVYIDEVAYPFSVQTQGQLFDLERTEILRGPQGTLYGRNSTGGAINFITRKPTKTFESEVKASYGSYNSRTLEGFVSGPLTDDLRGRLSLLTEQGGAWQKNRDTGQSLGDKDITSLRGQLEWDATPDLSFNLSLFGGEDKSESRGARLYEGLIPNATYGVGYNPIAAERDRRLTGWGLRPEYAALTGLGVNDKPHKDNSSFGASLATNLVINDSLLLTSVTGYNQLKRREFIDWDGSIIPQSDEYFKTDIKVFSQELRLASFDAARFNWVVGGYYSNERLDESFYSDFYANLGRSVLTSYDQDAETFSLFGQSTYKLTDTVSLVAGIRQEREERNLNDFSSQRIDDVDPNMIGYRTFAPQGRSLKTDSTSGKLGIEWRPADGQLYYAHVSRGVKSGGFTAYNSTFEEQIDPFKPEKLLAYEAGFKVDIGRTLRLNGSLFFYDYRDQQWQSQVWIDPQIGNIGRLVNIPKSEIRGGELELLWEPLAGLSISQFVGYKEGKYKEFYGLDAAATRAVSFAYPIYTDFSGDKLTNFPETSYGGALSYTFRVGDFNLNAQTDYSYRDTLHASIPSRSIQSYWLANARLSVAPVNDKWELALYARNLFDKHYDIYHGSFLSNAQMAHSGDPRFAGIEARYRF